MKLKRRSPVWFHLYLAPVPDPWQAWQETPRAYCCVFVEVYRLFDDWWHTIWILHSSSFVGKTKKSPTNSFPKCSRTRTREARFTADDACFRLTAVTLEGFMISVFLKRSRFTPSNERTEDLFFVWRRRETAVRMVPEGSEEKEEKKGKK